MKRLVRRRLTAVAALAAMLAGSAAPACTAPRSCPVESGSAREITVVTFQASTGSRLPVASGVHGKFARRLARQAFVKTDPGARIWQVSPLDTTQFDLLVACPEGGAAAPAEDLASEMKCRCSTQLLTDSLRADADPKALNSSQGSGNTAWDSSTTEHKIAGLTATIERVSAEGLPARLAR